MWRAWPRNGPLDIGLAAALASFFIACGGDEPGQQAHQPAGQRCGQQHRRRTDVEQPTTPVHVAVGRRDGESGTETSYGSPLEAATKVFATQNPNQLALSFSASYGATLPSSSSTSTQQGTALAVGSASLDPRTYTVSDVLLDEVSIRPPDGGPALGFRFLRTSDGPSAPHWLDYTFRKPLDAS